MCTYEFICKPLEIIYEPCFEKGCFPSEWKKPHVLPAPQKSEK